MTSRMSCICQDRTAPLATRRGERGGGDQLITVAGLLAVEIDYRVAGGVASHLPSVHRLVRIDSLASNHRGEPELLDIDGQVLDQTEQRPPGGQQGPVRLFLGETIQGTQHLITELLKVSQKHVDVSPQSLTAHGLLAASTVVLPAISDGAPKPIGDRNHKAAYPALMEGRWWSGA